MYSLHRHPPVGQPLIVLHVYCDTLTLVSHEVCKVPDEFSNEKLAAVFIKCVKVVGMELKLIVLSEHH